MTQELRLALAPLKCGGVASSSEFTTNLSMTRRPEYTKLLQHDQAHCAELHLNLCSSLQVNPVVHCATLSQSLRLAYYH